MGPSSSLWLSKSLLDFESFQRPFLCQCVPVRFPLASYCPCVSPEYFHCPTLREVYILSKNNIIESCLHSILPQQAPTPLEKQRSLFRIYQFQRPDPSDHGQRIVTAREARTLRDECSYRVRQYLVIECLPIRLVPRVASWRDIDWRTLPEEYAPTLKPPSVRWDGG